MVSPLRSAPAWVPIAAGPIAAPPLTTAPTATAAAAPKAAPAPLPLAPITLAGPATALALDPIAAAFLLPTRILAQLGAASTAPAPRSFFDLPADLQAQIRDRMRPFVGQPEVLRRYANLVTSDAFVGAPRDAQLAAADALARLPHDATLGKDLRGLLGDAKVRALDPSVQAALAHAYATPGRDRAVREDLRATAGTPAFQQLSPARQEDVVRGIAAHPSASNPLLFLIGNGALHTLPEAAQEKAIRAVGQPGASEAVRDTVDRLTQAPEFARLDATAQGRWLDALGSRDATVRDRAAARLDEWMNKPGYQKRGVDDRALILTKLSRGADLPETVDAKPGDYDRFHSNATLSGGTKVAVSKAFESGPPADARTYSVAIDGRKIQVVIPTETDPAGGRYPTIDEITASLERMPKSSRKELERIVVEPRADESAGARARAKGTISIYPVEGGRTRDALTSMLVHEAGHELGERLWGPLAEHGKGWKAWERAVEKDDAWPSSYATTSFHEDLAETMVLYQRVRGTGEEAAWRAKMPERFAILDRVVK